MFRCLEETPKKDLFAQTHALARTMSNPGSPALSEALEATTLNVDVDDPKLYHGNCVDVIADGSVDLVLNDPPRSWLGLSTRSRFFPTRSTTDDSTE